MTGKEIVMYLIILAVALLSLPFSIKAAIKNYRTKRAKFDGDISDGKINSVIKIMYSAGIDTFQENEYATLALLATEISITQGAVTSASLPYSRIIYADVINLDELVRNPRLGIVQSTPYSCLVIKFLAKDGSEKQLLFRKLVASGNFALFMYILQQRIPPKIPTHTAL